MPNSSLTAQQAKPAQTKMEHVQHFLDYAATQEPAITTFSASDMILAIQSNAGYLSEEGPRSRARGIIFSPKMFQTHQTMMSSTTKLPLPKQSCHCP